MNSVVTQRQIAQSESFYGRLTFFYADAVKVWEVQPNPTPPPASILVEIYPDSPPVPLPPFLDSYFWQPFFEPVTVNFKLIDATHKQIYFVIAPGYDLVASGGDVDFRGDLTFKLKQEIVCQIPIFFRFHSGTSTAFLAETVPSISTFPIFNADTNLVPTPCLNLLGFEAAEGATPRMVFQAPMKRVCNADSVTLTMRTFQVKGPSTFYGYLVILNEFNY